MTQKNEEFFQRWEMLVSHIPYPILVQGWKMIISHALLNAKGYIESCFGKIPLTIKSVLILECVKLINLFNFFSLIMPKKTVLYNLILVTIDLMKEYFVKHDLLM